MKPNNDPSTHISLSFDPSGLYCSISISGKSFQKGQSQAVPEKTIHMFQLYSGHLITTFDRDSVYRSCGHGHTGKINSIQWMQDCQQFSSCGNDGLLLFWKIHEMYAVEEMRQRYMVLQARRIVPYSTAITPTQDAGPHILPSWAQNEVQPEQNEPHVGLPKGKWGERVRETGGRIDLHHSPEWLKLSSTIISPPSLVFNSEDGAWVHNRWRAYTFSDAEEDVDQESSESPIQFHEPPVPIKIEWGMARDEIEIPSPVANMFHFDRAKPMEPKLPQSPTDNERIKHGESIKNHGAQYSDEGTYDEESNAPVSPSSKPEPSNIDRHHRGTEIPMDNSNIEKKNGKHFTINHTTTAIPEQTKEENEALGATYLTILQRAQEKRQEASKLEKNAVMWLFSTLHSPTLQGNTQERVPRTDQSIPSASNPSPNQAARKLRRAASKDKLKNVNKNDDTQHVSQLENAMSSVLENARNNDPEAKEFIRQLYEQLDTILHSSSS